MKATGIVRRLDSLGRAVVPKELRRSLGWDEGTPIEIFTVDGGVVFKEYKPSNEQIENFQEKMNSLLLEYKSYTDSEGRAAARHRAFGYATALLDACTDILIEQEMNDLWETEYREKFGF